MPGGPLIVGPFTSSIDPTLAENLARIAARLDAIGGVGVKLVSPVYEDGEILIVAGDDYLDADGRGIVMTSDAWPDLTGATVNLTAIAMATGATILDSTPVTVTSPVADEVGPAALRLELTSEQTAAFPLGRRAMRFAISATLANTSLVTLVQSYIGVVPNIGD